MRIGIYLNLSREGSSALGDVQSFDKGQNVKERWVKAIHRALQATSFVLVLKGAVGGSVMLLGMFGVAVPIVGPFFGVDANPQALGSGVAAIVGAILGVVAAVRA